MISLIQHYATKFQMICTIGKVLFVINKSSLRIVLCGSVVHLVSLPSEIENEANCFDELKALPLKNRHD